ncbi:MAG: murein biosynthesis integral membrane protein MurJ [Oscillospiraceae bacterium]|nr:murein biosynthesis integral membrane protein MurJ [Oscillospiraceae bacterium]
MKPVRTVALMMGATVVAKLLGMVRQIVIARNFGTGDVANAITAASNFPLTFFDLLLGAAVLGCFIPVYNSFKGDKQAGEFACIFFNIILLVTGLLTVIGIIFADPIIKFLVSGLEENTIELAAAMLRIMFPMIMFTGTAYTLVGILQSKGKYILPAFISAISNAGVIIYLLCFDNIYGLAFAYLASWFIQLITLLIPLLRNGFKYRFILDFKNEALRRTFKMIPPIMVGSWLSPMMLFSGMHFSSYTGNITVFEYSYNLFLIISGILVHSIVNYIFPVLSRLNVNGDAEQFASIIRTGLITSLMIMIPVMFAVYVLGGEGISVLYLGGEFTSNDAYLTTVSLRWMAYGMPAFAVIELSNRVFYSCNMPKIPMIASISGIVGNISLSAIFVYLFDLGNGAIGLAVAVAQTITAVILIIFLHVKIKGIFTNKFIISMVKIAISSAAAFLIMLFAYHFYGNNPYESEKINNIIVGVVIFIIGAAIYFGGLFITRVKIKEENNV